MAYVHYTEKFEGERYSIVYFTNDQFDKVSSDLQVELAQFGIDFPWNDPTLRAALSRKRSS